MREATISINYGYFWEIWESLISILLLALQRVPAIKSSVKTLRDLCALLCPFGSFVAKSSYVVQTLLCS